MTGLKRTTPSASDPAGSDDWQPRRAQETQLAQLEAWLAAPPPGESTTETEIRRAVLLHALDRNEQAQQAFIAILRREPTNFSALNEFGTFLVNTGAIAAACRVYSEAIAHHPDNPMARINLANLLLRANSYAEAREHYEAALRLDPEHPQAHQGLGAVFADLGDRETAQAHFRLGFRGHAVSTQPYRGSKAPIALLELVSSGGGNIPTSAFLDNRVFLTTVIVADYLDPSSSLPPHHLIFNAIGDADLCQSALAAAVNLVAGTPAPVINDPRAVMKTGRIDNARRLSGIPGVVTARTAAIARAALTGLDAAAILARHGLHCPLLLRSPGFHTGRNFVRVETAAETASAAESLPGDELLAIEYLDARGGDGSARKYRAMMIDGQIYPLHLAISRDWKVHYFTSDMAERPDHRTEEAAFLADMRAALGARAIKALEGIRDALGLDYCGVDFGLDRNGNVLLFEANATMVIASPDADPRWDYRRVAIDRILEAVTAMIRRRAAGPMLTRPA